MNIYSKGHFRCGMPYNRFGSGKRILVVFQGLMFDNKPISGFLAKKFAEMYGSLLPDYSIYLVNRKAGLPKGYLLKDMASDYAQMIKEEFDGPVDVLGISTGGSIAQHFGANHPNLVHSLVIHSSAYMLNEAAKKGQMKVARLAAKRKWRAAYMALMEVSLPKGPIRYILKPFFFLISLFGASIFGKPDDPSDLVNTIEAEDKHDFKESLSKIKAPTLVIAGEKDPFYTKKLFYETSEGIPHSKLIIYKGMGHPASGKQFKNDLRKFLLDVERN